MNWRFIGNEVAGWGTIALAWYGMDRVLGDVSWLFYIPAQAATFVVTVVAITLIARS